MKNTLIPIRLKMNALKKNLPIRLCVALCAALAVYFERVPYPPATKTGLAIIALLFAAALTLIFLTADSLQNRAETLSRAQRRGVIALSLAAAAILLLIRAVRIPDRYLILPEGAVAVRTLDGAPAELTLFSSGATDALDHYRTVGGLVYRGPVFHEILLQFKTGPGFGSVEIVQDDNPDSAQVILLSAESAGLETVRLPYPDPILNRLVLILVFGATLSALIWAGLIFAVSRPVEKIPRPAPGSPRRFGLALPMVLVWTVMLAVYYPGILTPDSNEQYRQAVTGVLSDWHPASYALTMRPFALLFKTPAAVAFFQILCLALLAAEAIELLGRYGLPKPARIALAALFTLAPPNLFFPITLWKDIPYALCQFWMFRILLEAVLSNSESLRKRTALIALTLSAVGVSLYRHNGVPIAIGSVIVYAVFLPKCRKKLLLAAALTLGSIILIRGPLYDRLNVRKSGFAGVNQIYVQLIAAHLEAGTPLDPAERETIEKIAPLESWVYDSCVIGTIRIQPGFDIDRAMVQTGANLKTVLSLTKKAPLVTARHFVTSSRMIWQLQPGSCYLYRIGVEKYGDGSIQWVVDWDDVTEASKIPALTRPLFELFAVTVRRTIIDSIFWRPALLSWLTLFLIVLTALRNRNPKLLLAAVPTLLQCGLMMFITVGQDARFQYGAVLIGLLCLGIPFLKNPELVDKDEPA